MDDPTDYDLLDLHLLGANGTTVKWGQVPFDLHHVLDLVSQKRGSREAEESKAAIDCER